MELIQNIPLTLEDDELILILRGNPESKKSRLLIKQHGDLFDEALKLAVPRALYEMYPVDRIENNHLYLAGSTEPLESRLFPLIIPGARQVVLGVVTIGEALENRANDYMKNGEYVHGLILDSLGTLALQKTSLHLYKILQKGAEDQGLNASTPMSPGQIDWKLTEQRKIFSRLEAEKAGIRLAKSSLMLPKKSLSLLVGMGTDVETKKKVCHLCPLKATCPSRKVHEYRQQREASAREGTEAP